MAGTSAFDTIRAAAPTISVGMLTADLSNLAAEMRLLESTSTPLVHFDVMDGCFCPMTTIGPPIIEAVETSLLKDVHLMIDAPLEKLGQYVDAGADVVSVHVEADRHIHRVFQTLGQLENRNDRDRGIVRGAALNPGTALETLEPLMDEIELIVLLAINPGWGGQKFDAATPRRLERARRMVEESGRDILLALDGGITRQNIADVGALRPDIVVTGSAVFDGKAPVENAKYMLESLGA
jgi:ribulose-phosphate 3-epimerase